MPGSTLFDDTKMLVYELSLVRDCVVMSSHKDVSVDEHVGMGKKTLSCFYFYRCTNAFSLDANRKCWYLYCQILQTWLAKSNSARSESLVPGRQPAHTHTHIHRCTLQFIMSTLYCSNRKENLYFVVFDWEICKKATQNKQYILNRTSTQISLRHSQTCDGIEIV